jgi:extradiol dioxygenase family protein
LSNIFHLAIPAGSLPITIPFYIGILGCKLGPHEKGKWQDIDFWGNELTLHESKPRFVKGPERERHDVEMGQVCVPHFGVHLDWMVYNQVKESVFKTVGFLDAPYTRFEGQVTKQETFFVEDPNLNVLEIKSLQGTYYKNKL